MKGFIRQNNGNWFIKYVIHYKDEYRLSQIELALHPDDSKFMNDYMGDLENIENRLYNCPEVEFEIVELEEGFKVAKLNSPFVLSLNERQE